MLDDEKLSSRQKRHHRRALHFALSRRAQDLEGTPWDSLDRLTRRVTYSKILRRFIDGLREAVQQHDAVTLVRIKEREEKHRALLVEREERSTKRRALLITHKGLHRQRRSARARKSSMIRYHVSRQRPIHQKLKGRQKGASFQASRIREVVPRTTPKSTTGPLRWSSHKLILARRKRMAPTALQATKSLQMRIGETVRKITKDFEGEEGPLEWSRRRIILARRQDRLRRERAWEATAGSQHSAAGRDMPAFARLRTEEQQQLADDVYEYMSNTAR